MHVVALPEHGLELAGPCIGALMGQGIRAPARRPYVCIHRGRVELGKLASLLCVPDDDPACRLPVRTRRPLVRRIDQLDQERLGHRIRF
jgi:hypothetical protein